MRSSTFSVLFPFVFFIRRVETRRGSGSHPGDIESDSSLTEALYLGNYAAERCKTGYVDLSDFKELSFSKSVDAVRGDVEVTSQLQCNNCQRSGFPSFARCVNNDFKRVPSEKMSWSCSAEFPNSGFTVEYSHLDCLPQTPDVVGCVKLDSCIMTITVTAKYPWGLVIGILGGYTLMGLVFLLMDRRYNILHSECQPLEDDAFPNPRPRKATCPQSSSYL